MNELIFDFEGDGLQPTKMHCISANWNGKPIGTKYDYDSVRVLLSRPECDFVAIGHNIIQFDVPHLSRLTETDYSDTIFLDTLAISWYLFPLKNRHGLEEWGEYFGFKKVKIDDWENLSQEKYTERCERDVLINQMLWDLFKSRLLEMYGSMKKVYSVCKYLTFKLRTVQKACESQIKVDVPRVQKNIKTLQELAEARIEVLKPVMPPIPRYRTMTKPKKMYKTSDWSLTVIGERWYNICKEQGKNPKTTEELEVFVKNKEPNPSSHQQVKDWLFSLGWEPCTYKSNKDKKEIPQLSDSNTGELTNSVRHLSAIEPAIEELEGLFTLNSRIATLKGFLKNSDEKGYIKAEISGFTNTLRMKHKTLVNIPAMDKPYGEYIRSCLIAREGKVFCGSDMSSLEDRTKQHYMVPYDPQYVKEMNTEGFDPHLDIALLANLMTQKEVDQYRAKVNIDILKPKRHGAKTTNYCCTYGAFPTKVAKTAGISLEEGTKLYNTYWKRNWSIKTIAEDCHVQEFYKLKWLWNPVSEMWYWLRYEKDRFSTLNQGTGSYCFDTWVAYILKERPQINAQFHDEVVLEINPGEEEEVRGLLKRSIQKVNKNLKLRRDLDVGVDFGDNYGKIH